MRKDHIKKMERSQDEKIQEENDQTMQDINMFSNLTKLLEQSLVAIDQKNTVSKGSKDPDMKFDEYMQNPSLKNHNFAKR